MIDKKSTSPEISLFCPICKKQVEEHHKDDIQTWWICENGHQTAAPIKQEIGEIQVGLKLIQTLGEIEKKRFELLRSVDLVEYVFRDLNRRVKYDLTTKGSVLYTALSAALPEPLNLNIKAPSGSGKSYNAVETLKFFLEEDIWFLAGMSPKAIAHERGKLLDINGEEIDVSDRPEKPRRSRDQSPEEYKETWESYKLLKKAYIDRLKNSYHYINIDHKIFVFLESPDPDTIRMLYPLLSHDKRRVVFKYVDSKLNTVTVVLEGWPAVIFLGTDKKYIEELATRSFTVSPEEKAEKIEAANELTNLKASLPWECILETEEYRNIVGLIRDVRNRFTADKLDVLVPFIGLYQAFPKDIVRDMRDFSHFTQFLKAFTALKLYQRPCVTVDKQKYVLATAQDVVDTYAIYRRLLESTRTGTEQRILDFYETFVKQKSEWHVSELTTEYNTSARSKRSDFTIRSWLERLNEIGYVDKREDPSDKRANIYIPLVKEKLENGLISENQVNLETVLRKGFESWKNNICRVTTEYTKNNFDKEPVSLESLEGLIVGPEKIFSVFDSDLFKYPNNSKETPKEEKELESAGIEETKAISNILIVRPTHNGQKCDFCELLASEFEIDDNGNRLFICKTDLQETIIPSYKRQGYEIKMLSGFLNE